MDPDLSIADAMLQTISIPYRVDILQYLGTSTTSGAILPSVDVRQYAQPSSHCNDALQWTENYRITSTRLSARTGVFRSLQGQCPNNCPGTSTRLLSVWKVAEKIQNHDLEKKLKGRQHYWTVSSSAASLGIRPEVR